MSARDAVVELLRGNKPNQLAWTIAAPLIPRGQLERELRNNGLCLVKHAGICKTSYPHVEIQTSVKWKDGEQLISRTYHTPVGSVSERVTTEYPFYYEGGYAEWILDYQVKKASDYEVIRFIVEDATYQPDYENILMAQERLGGDGIVFASVGRCPLQRLSIEFAGFERLVYDLHDHPSVIEDLLSIMEERQYEIYKIAVESPAEFIWSPDNISASRTPPKWFERYCLPFYNRYGALLHQAGKRYVAHMDGDLQGIKHLVAQCDLDVIEAFTPPPMGDLSINEALSVWPDKIISCNFPATLFLENEAVVYKYTLDLLAEAQCHGRFLLGITEDLPEESLEKGLPAIRRAMDHFWENS
ncbi:MAG: uroporphyrinogen decarboxylase family protein [Anaerolineales bacterium]|jgi:hypothetical protein